MMWIGLGSPCDWGWRSATDSYIREDIQYSKHALGVHAAHTHHARAVPCRAVPRPAKPSAPAHLEHLLELPQAVHRLHRVKARHRGARGVPLAPEGLSVCHKGAHFLDQFALEADLWTRVNVREGAKQGFDATVEPQQEINRSVNVLLPEPSQPTNC
jgi:hypothetical protein